jgi:hypothetical protein
MGHAFTSAPKIQIGPRRPTLNVGTVVGDTEPDPQAKSRQAGSA